MNPPRRLLEETDNELERTVLTAGRAYCSLPRTRQQVVMAVGLVGSATAASTVTALAWSRLAELGSTKLLVGLSAVAVMAAIPAGYTLWHGSQPAPAPATTRSPIATPPAPAGPARSDEAVPSREPELAPAASVLTTGKVRATPAPPSPEPRSATPKPSLAAELSALDAARAKLYGGDASGALALLNAYARDYPLGRLSLEAEALRIDALAKSGNLRVAKARAQAFVRRHPRGVLAARVRRYLAD